MLPFLITGWKKIKNLLFKDFISIAAIGFIGGTLGTSMITKAFFAAMDDNIALSTVILLQKLQPFFVIFLASFLLKEVMPKFFYAWATVAVAAAYFLSYEGGPIFQFHLMNQAALFGILAAFFYASSTVFGKRLLNHIDYKTATGLRYISTMFFLFIYICIVGHIKIVGDIATFQWNYIIILGLLSVFGFFLYYYALKKTSASLTTIGELFWPFSALILDYIFNGNTLNVIQVLAAVVLVISFYFISKQGNLKLPKFSALTTHGKNGGNFIGFNTVDLDNIKIDIDHGVYAVYATIYNKKYKGLLNFGYQEVFGGDQHMELYLPDFVGNYYGIMIDIKILKKIRNVKKFKNVEESKEGMRKNLTELENIK